MFKLFTKRKKFSKENLIHQCTLLEKNPKINPRNKQLVIETLRQIAELMIWGDQNDDSFFHMIAERNILGYFLSIIKQKYHRSVTIQVMQTLSIMIQNISKQQSLYYLFSNNYINDLIVHDFDFTDNEILAYYVSFLKTISLKLDGNVINFFFNAKAHDFPLYSEALKFFKNEDQMVRIAVRTLTLNVFGVDDPDLRQFITDKSAVPYFSNLTWFIRDQCIVLNETLNKAIYGQQSQQDAHRNREQKERPILNGDRSHSPSSSFIANGIANIKKNMNKTPSPVAKTTSNKNTDKTPTNQLQRGVEEQVDHYYYLEDIFLLSLRQLSEKLMNQLLSHLVLPVLVGSLVDVDKLVKKQQDIESEYEREMNDIDDNKDNINMILSYNFIEIEDIEKSTSNIEVGDDDTQKASAIRKFLERRTRISKQLSLFLLTQVLTVFSDGKLINAIIVALMHPSPPKLVNQIVLKPPQHAVESKIPISEVLTQKQSYYRKNSSSAPATPSHEHNNDEKKSNRSELMLSVLENDEQNKIQRSRIDSVEKMDIIHEDSNLPEDSNMYRNELLNMLNSDPTQTQNEQLIASATALILTLIRNKATSEELLITAGICPQKRKRKRQLFSNKAANVVHDSYATSSTQKDRRDLLPENEATTHHSIELKPRIEKGKDKEIEIDHHEESNKPNLPLPSPTSPTLESHPHALPSPITNATRARSQPPVNYKEDMICNGPQERESERENESTDKKKKTRARAQSNPDIPIANKHINGVELHNKYFSTRPSNIATEALTRVMECDYPFEFVECIINVLSQCSKLSVFTIRVLSELLIDFVQDRTMKNNGLNDKHYVSLLSVWDNVKLRLSEYLPLESEAMRTYFIDTFEEEWRSVREQPRIDTLIANPIRILPPHVFHANTTKKPETQETDNDSTGSDRADGNREKETNADKSNMDQQQLIRKLERIRKSLHNLLHISRLKTELLGGTVNLPFVPRAEFKYYYRLQVALSTIAPQCLNCLVLMQSKKRRRVLFSVREADWLLLFNRMKGRAGFAMIYMAIPIHNIEGVVNKLDPRVVHLSIRSPVRPHDAAIPISSQKNKWSITLFFDSMFPPKQEQNENTQANHKEPQIGHKDALYALQYITENRKRVRRKMMKQISDLVSDTSSV